MSIFPSSIPACARVRSSYEELLLSGEGMQKTKNDLIYIGHEIAF